MLKDVTSVISMLFKVVYTVNKMFLRFLQKQKRQCLHLDLTRRCIETQATSRIKGSRAAQEQPDTKRVLMPDIKGASRSYCRAPKIFTACEKSVRSAFVHY